jgi:hypothetical protein
MNLEGCPMKDSLKSTFGGGMSLMHGELRRKQDRKEYKEKLFDHLSEWVYPSQNK